MSLSPLDVELLRRLQASGRFPEEQLAELRARAEQSGAPLLRLLPMLGLDSDRVVTLQVQPDTEAGPPRAYNPELRLPERLGPYRLEARLGEGGMGIVVKSRHPMLDKPVAIKVLKPAAGQTEADVQRFVAEGQTAANLPPHPNIVRVLNADDEDGLAYIVFDYVDGTSLRDLIDAGKVSARAGMRVLAKICDALDHIHAAGIVHRDIKPSNILIDRESTPLLTDFGVARRLERDTLTMTGSFLGTIDYMAPEQAEDPSRVDHRADVYAVGAILYEVLTGRPPLQGGSAVEKIARLINGAPPAPRELAPQLSRELEAVCLRAMARDPRDRYEDAGALGRALDALRSGQETPLPSDAPTRRRRASRPRGAGLPSSPEGAGRWLPAGLGLCLALTCLAFALRASQSSPVDARPASVARLSELSPAEGAWMTSTQEVVSGRLTPSGGDLSLRFEGEGGAVIELRARPDPDGRFQVATQLEAGAWRLDVAHIPQPKAAPVLLERRRFGIDLAAPELRIEPVPEQTEAASLRLRGEVEDPTLTTLVVAGRIVEPRGRRFEAEVALRPGLNELLVVATDAAGRRAEALARVTRLAPEAPAADPPAPTPEEPTPPEPKETGPEGAEQPSGPGLAELRIEIEGSSPILARSSPLELRGRIIPADAALSINDEPVACEGGRFVWRGALPEGASELRLRLARGEQVLLERLPVIVDSRPPELKLTLAQGAEGGRVTYELSLESNEPVTEVTTWLASAAPGAAPVEVKGSRRVVSLAPTQRWRCRFSVTGGISEMRLEVRDVAGNLTRARVPLRPTPAGAAPGGAAPGGAAPDISVVYGASAGRKVPIELRQTGARPLTLRAGELELIIPPGGVCRFELRESELEAGVLLEGEGQQLYLGPGLRLALDLADWVKAGARAAGRAEQDREVLLISQRLGASYRFLGVEERRVGRAQLRVPRWEHAATGLVLRLVPGGTVRLGLSDDELARLLAAYELGSAPELRFSRELVERAVGPLLIAEAEVSEAQVAALLGGAGGALPACDLTSLKAQLFTQRAGGGLRLPRDEEWEHACRAGTTSLFPWGDAPDAAQALITGALRATTAELESRQPLGLRDVLGNAPEWAEVTADAPVGGIRKGKVLRGGGLHARLSCSALREVPGFGGPDRGGLRPARGLDVAAIQASCWSGR